jgi:hypothetical protein
MKMAHLILDVDGTLSAEYEICARPHLHIFLCECFALFKSVSLWSAASRSHIDCVVRECLSGYPFRFIWTSEKCTQRGSYEQQIKVKKLKRAFSHFPDMDEHNTLIVDNTPTTYMLNYGNAVPVETFYGERDDKALPRLLFSLECIRAQFLAEGTVRHINKFV